MHDLADDAYFQRTAIVASAHNMPVDSYPWRFASVISVASHSVADPFTFHYNPVAAGRVLRPWRRRRGRVAGRRRDPCHR